MKRVVVLVLSFPCCSWRCPRRGDAGVIAVSQPNGPQILNHVQLISHIFARVFSSQTS